MEQEYISEIIIELRPRSRYFFCRLFGIRENKSFKKNLFDKIDFKKEFLNQFNKKVLQRGEYIQCHNLIVKVKQIKKAPSSFTGTTELEFLLKGRQLTNEFIESLNINTKDGRLNQSFIDDLLTKNGQINVDIEVEHIYSCYCSECKKSLNEGEFYVKSGNWNRPILCLSCYNLLFTHKCVRCNQSITFNHDSLKSNDLTSIRFVQYNDYYWHSDCCVCVTCLQSLIGIKFYQDQIYHQLFCLEHIPDQY